MKHYHGIIVHKRLADLRRVVLLKGRCAESKRGLLLHCSNLAWTKSGGRIPWNVTVICETSDGKTSYERRFGEPFKGPAIPFGSMIEYQLAKDQSRLYQIGKTILPGTFFGYALYAGGFWTGEIVVAGIQDLEKMDVSEIHSRSRSSSRRTCRMKCSLLRGARSSRCSSM